MSDPVTDTPTSPPAAPVIPAGLGTFVGLGTGAGQWVAAIIAAVNGDHNATTIALIITGALTVMTTLAGRFAQAHAAIKTQGLPSAVLGELQTFTADSDDERTSPEEKSLGQTDPDTDLDVSSPNVPPDEGDAGVAEVSE